MNKIFRFTFNGKMFVQNNWFRMGLPGPVLVNIFTRESEKSLLSTLNSILDTWRDMWKIQIVS